MMDMNQYRSPVFEFLIAPVAFLAAALAVFISWFLPEGYAVEFYLGLADPEDFEDDDNYDE